MKAITNLTELRKRFGSIQVTHRALYDYVHHGIIPAETEELDWEDLCSCYYTPAWGLIFAVQDLTKALTKEP
jgi:hypothetical protein